MQGHGPPPPDRRVGCTGPGAPGYPGRACGRKGDLEGLSLRAKQPRRGGSQLWRLADARVKSRGLSKPWCKKRESLHPSSSAVVSPVASGTEQAAPGCLGRSCGRECDLSCVSFACKATKEKRVSAVAFVGRDGGVMGLVEALVQEGLDRNSAELGIELREPAA